MAVFQNNSNFLVNSNFKKDKKLVCQGYLVCKTIFYWARNSEYFPRGVHDLKMRVLSLCLHLYK